MLLLDSDIMVDILLAYPPAVDWLGEIGGKAPALPGFVILELMDGCRNKMEMKRLLKRIDPFRVYWPTDADCNRALIGFARYRLSHGLSIIDVMIGECAVGLNATLCTFNTKHFKPIARLKTKQPYSKPEDRGARTERPNAMQAGCLRSQEPSRASLTRFKRLCCTEARRRNEAHSPSIADSTT